MSTTNASTNGSLNTTAAPSLGNVITYNFTCSSQKFNNLKDETGNSLEPMDEH